MECLDTVELDLGGTRRIFIYRCSEYGIKIRNKLHKHLILKQKYDAQGAHFKQSEMRVLYLRCISAKHGQSVPAPCLSCKEWFVRIEEHLIHSNKHNININVL